MTALSITGLLPRTAASAAARSSTGAPTCSTLDDRAMNRVRGEQISMIFQSPRASLNPLYRVETTLEQVLRAHRGLRGTAARQRRDRPARRRRAPRPAAHHAAVPARALGRHVPARDDRLRARVGAEPAHRGRADHGARRDVQLQIIQLLARLRREHGLTLILITHNLSVIAELCDRVLVMYLGRDRRGRAGARDLRPAAPSVHGRAARLRVRARTIGRRARGDPRLGSRPPRASHRLPVPSALLLRAGRLRRTGSPLASRREAPLRRVPLLARGCVTAPCLEIRGLDQGCIGFRTRDCRDASASSPRTRSRSGSRAGRRSPLVGESGSGKTTVGPLRAPASGADTPARWCSTAEPITPG